MRWLSPYILVAVAAAAATALALAAAPAAQADNPQVNFFQFGYGEPFTWNDFCGTGTDIVVSLDYRGIEFLDPNQPVDERVKLEGKTVYLNPLNGKTVTLHIAATFWSTTVSGDRQGLHVVESTTKGLAISFRGDRGGVLIRDAGLFTVRETYNGDDFVSREILVDHGGHPFADTGFDLCTVVPEGLGLT